MFAIPASEDECSEICSLLTIDQNYRCKLMASIKSVNYESGHKIYRVGEESVAICYLRTSSTTAAVEIVSGEQFGRSVRIERIVQGDCFGEIEYLTLKASGSRSRRIASAYAVGQAEVLEIPYKFFAELDPETHSAFMSTLGIRIVRRLQAYTGLIGQARFSDKQILLAEWLIETAEDLGEKEGSGQRIRTKFRQAEIGSAVGLSREAVNLHFGEWERAGLLEIDQGSLLIRDYDRLRQLVWGARQRTLSSHASVVQKVDACLEAGEAFRARNLGLEALRHYPRSAEIQHRTVLATVRCGAVGEAKELLAQFGFDDFRNIELLKARLVGGIVAPESRRRGDQTGYLEDLIEDETADTTTVATMAQKRLPTLLEDVLALKGRVLKSELFTAVTEAERESLCKQALEAYKFAYRATGGVYSGINTATLQWMAGESAEAVRTATAVLKKMSAGTNFWDHCSRGEACLLLRKFGAAQHHYRLAADAGDRSEGKIASARLQLRRMAELTGCVEIRPDTLLPPSVVGATELASNHLGTPLAQFAATAADLVKRNQLTHLHTSLLGAFDFALAASLPKDRDLHLVLPTSVSAFANTLEKEDYRETYRGLIARARSIAVVGCPAPSRSRLPIYARFAGMVCLGQCMLHADLLEGSSIVLGRGTAVALPENGIKQEPRLNDLAKIGYVVLIHSLEPATAWSAIESCADHVGLAGFDLLDQVKTPAVALKGAVDRILLFIETLATTFNESKVEYSLLCDCDLLFLSGRQSPCGRALAIANRWKGIRLAKRQVIATEPFAALTRLSGLPRDAISRVGRLSTERELSSRPLPSRVLYHLRPRVRCPQLQR